MADDPLYFELKINDAEARRTIENIKKLATQTTISNPNNSMDFDSLSKKADAYGRNLQGLNRLIRDYESQIKNANKAGSSAEDASGFKAAQTEITKLLGFIKQAQDAKVKLYTEQRGLTSSIPENDARFNGKEVVKQIADDRRSAMEASLQTQARIDQANQKIYETEQRINAEKRRGVEIDRLEEQAARAKFTAAQQSTRTGYTTSRGDDQVALSEAQMQRRGVENQIRSQERIAAAEREFQIGAQAEAREKEINVLYQQREDLLSAEAAIRGKIADDSKAAAEQERKSMEAANTAARLQEAITVSRLQSNNASVQGQPDRQAEVYKRALAANSQAIAMSEKEYATLETQIREAAGDQAKMNSLILEQDKAERSINALMQERLGLIDAQKAARQKAAENQPVSDNGAVERRNQYTYRAETTSGNAMGLGSSAEQLAALKEAETYAKRALDIQKQLVAAHREDDQTTLEAVNRQRDLVDMEQRHVAIKQNINYVQSEIDDAEAKEKAEAEALLLIHKNDQAVLEQRKKAIEASQTRAATVVEKGADQQAAASQMIRYYDDQKENMTLFQRRDILATINEHLRLAQVYARQQIALDTDDEEVVKKMEAIYKSLGQLKAKYTQESSQVNKEINPAAPNHWNTPPTNRFEAFFRGADQQHYLGMEINTLMQPIHQLVQPLNALTQQSSTLVKTMTDHGGAVDRLREADDKLAVAQANLASNPDFLNAQAQVKEVQASFLTGLGKFAPSFLVAGQMFASIAPVFQGVTSTYQLIKTVTEGTKAVLAMSSAENNKSATTQLSAGAVQNQAALQQQVAAAEQNVAALKEAGAASEELVAAEEQLMAAKAQVAGGASFLQKYGAMIGGAALAFGLVFENLTNGAIGQFNKGLQGLAGRGVNATIGKDDKQGLQAGYDYYKGLESMSAFGVKFGEIITNAMGRGSEEFRKALEKQGINAATGEKQYDTKTHDFMGQDKVEYDKLTRSRLQMEQGIANERRVMEQDIAKVRRDYALEIQQFEIDSARKRQDLEIQTSRKLQDEAAKQRDLNVEKQKFTENFAGQQEKQSYEYERYSKRRDYNKQIADETQDLNIKQGNETADLLKKQGDQYQDFFIKVGDKMADFTRKAGQQAEDFTIQQTRKVAEFGRKLADESQDFANKRKDKAVDLKDRVMDMYMGGGGSGMDMFKMLRDFKKDSFRETRDENIKVGRQGRDFNIEQQAAKEDFDRSQAREQRQTMIDIAREQRDLLKETSREKRDVGITQGREKEALKLKQGRESRDFNDQEADAAHQESMKLAKMENDRKYEAIALAAKQYDLNVEVQRTTEDYMIAQMRLTEDYNMESTKLRNKGTDIKNEEFNKRTDQAVQERDKRQSQNDQSLDFVRQLYNDPNKRSVFDDKYKNDPEFKKMADNMFKQQGYTPEAYRQTAAQSELKDKNADAMKAWQKAHDDKAFSDKPVISLWGETGDQWEARYLKEHPKPAGYASGSPGLARDGIIYAHEGEVIINPKGDRSTQLKFLKMASDKLGVRSMDSGGYLGEFGDPNSRGDAMMDKLAKDHPDWNDNMLNYTRGNGGAVGMWGPDWMQGMGGADAIQGDGIRGFGMGVRNYTSSRNGQGNASIMGGSAFGGGPSFGGGEMPGVRPSGGYTPGNLGLAWNSFQSSLATGGSKGQGEIINIGGRQFKKTYIRTDTGQQIVHLDPYGNQSGAGHGSQGNYYTMPGERGPGQILGREHFQRGDSYLPGGNRMPLPGSQGLAGGMHGGGQFHTMNMTVQANDHNVAQKLGNQLTDAFQNIVDQSGQMMQNQIMNQVSRNLKGMEQYRRMGVA
jgi:hypothetical protein